MIEYIYFVKCPNCDDEPFYFFDEAKKFALDCLSQKPIITQTEVNRNDFGECTDHCDLGTVWSWEEMMSDAEKEPSDEPSLLTKDFLNSVDADKDPEFDELDNSLDSGETIPEEEPELGLKLIEEFLLSEGLLTEAQFADSDSLDSIIKEFKGYCDKIGLKTIADLKDFVTRTSKWIEGDLFDKLKAYAFELNEIEEDSVRESCRKPVPEGMTIEQLVEEMEENEDEVECTWCNELFPKDQCRKEINLGWLCPRCADGIMSRGESLTFKENNYWDFLDEDAEIETVTEEPKLHTWTCWYDGDDIGEVEAYNKDEAEEKMIEYYGDEYFFDSFDHDFDVTLNEEGSLEEHVNEEHPAIESDQELEGTDNAIVDCKVADVVTHSEDEKPVDCKGEKKPLEKPLTEVIKMTKDELLTKEGTDNVDLINAGREPEERVELEEALLVDCPECGAEQSFDKESGVCNACGFII